MSTSSLKGSSATMLQAAANGAASANFSTDSADRTFQGIVTGTGAVSATIVVEGSNTGQTGEYISLGTITLTGTTKATDGFASNAKWTYVRARVTAATGTGAAVSVYMGY
jgi:formylmethanofuran dehydrogenase subunit C